MARTVTMFRGSTGLNTEIDPVRLPFDPRTGIQDLAVAYNVDHDDTGRISRRKGFAATIRTEDIHSLFCDGGECLFVTGNALCVLHADYTYTAIRNVTIGARMRCVQVDDQIYYTNGHETGRVKNSLSYSWMKGTYIGPDTTRQYSDPPIGSILEHFNGRIYVVQGKTVWHSEPFNHDAFDLARNYFDFGSNVTMFRAVSSGIWVSTERNTYFLAGGVPQEFIRTMVANYGAVEGTDDRVVGAKLGSGEMAGVGIIWTSTKGICFGSADGQFVNSTESKLSYPYARYGTGLCLGKRYVALLEP